MYNINIKKKLAFLRENPIKKWSFGKGKYIKHIDSINRWINRYSSEKGIYVSNKIRKEYPEVTGYWLETLLEFGYEKKAKTWFEWLVSIQNSDGGWPDPSLGKSIFFDSGQIIRGIKYYADLYNINVSKTVNNFIRYYKKAEDSHLLTDSDKIEDINWHLINLQVLWIVYKNWPEQVSLNTIIDKLKKMFEKWDVGHQTSHFDIYILEAMYEMKLFPHLFNKYLSYFDKKVSKFGLVPCDRKNNAPCYTATAQLGVLYYKMGRKKDADRILFNMLNRLDTRHGNWPGSGQGGNYIPNEEISWGLKYFLDLLGYYLNSSFDLEEQGYWDSISAEFDNSILRKIENSASNGSKVLDIGCGLGRYLDCLKNNFEVYGIDISIKNVNHCKKKELNVAKASITNIILPKNFPSRFNVIFSIEAFEHATFPANAINQMKKFIERDGKIIIIDKDPYSCFHYRLCPFERYYSKNSLRKLAKNSGLKISSFSKVGGFLVCEMINR